jgi:hypothetical protein
MKQQKYVNRQMTGAAQMVEFGVALYLLAAVIVFPLLGLFALLACLSVGQLATEIAVNQGANAPSYDLAVEAIDSALEKNILEGVGAFTHMHLFGGYQNTGADLYIDVRDKTSKTLVSVGPNLPLRKPADPKQSVFTYRLMTHLRAGPLLASKLVEITYLTRAIDLNFSASCPVERPDSLNLTLQKPDQSEAP